MRYLFSLITVLFSVSGVWGQMSRSTVEAYIAKYKDIALSNEKEYGIPAPITLAQGILESSAGTSSLTKASNNHFGMKGFSSWKGKVHLAWDDEKEKSRFRCYASAEESFRDHAQLLSTAARYRPLFNLSVYDYRGWAHGLKSAGYASAPDYAEALIGLIDLYKLYSVNGGVKLRPGKTVVITKYIDVVTPVFEPEEVMPEEEQSEEEEVAAEMLVRYVVEINDVRCTILQPGETLSNIARRYDISPTDLLGFNELATDRQLKEGDVVFLQKKKKRYNGPRDYYEAKEGETLHDVAQMFGVLAASLARLNNLSEYALLSLGDRVILK